MNETHQTVLLVVTEDESIKALVLEVFIDEEALWS